MSVLPGRKDEAHVSTNQKGNGVACDGGALVAGGRAGLITDLSIGAAAASGPYY
ncbi:MAG TPA: hypothetical protein VH520_03570 [Streptosporangiaceae bacterium]